LAYVIIAAEGYKYAKKKKLGKKAEKAVKKAVKKNNPCKRSKKK